MMYYLNHNMLSPAQYASALAACNGDFSPFSPDQKCQDAMTQSQKLLGQIDPYDIFNGSQTPRGIKLNLICFPPRHLSQ
jgi:hypothetical protein